MTMDEAWTTRVGVRRLEDVQLLRLVGSEVCSWLQGQVTSDVRSLRRGDAHYSLALNTAGRILADLWLLVPGHTLAEAEEQPATDLHELWLLVPRAACPKLEQSWRARIIMEDVELLSTDEHAVLSLQGPRALETVAAAGMRACAYPCDRLGLGGFDLVFAKDAAADTYRACERAAVAIGGAAIDTADWELARLRAGIPGYGAELDDRALPHEAGLVRRAVAFGKGCYVGQEAVNMLEHRGKPPRHLVQLQGHGGQLPGRHELLLDGEGRSVGFITSAVFDPTAANGILALGYVRREQAVVGARLQFGNDQARIERNLTV